MRAINEIINDLSQSFTHYEKEKSKGGQVIKFLPWTACRRILDQCAPGWCSEVKSVQEISGRIVATVRIYIPAAEGLIYRENSAQVREPEKGEKMYGDPTKNAISDAFRRAAAMFGVGDYLRGKGQTFGDKAATSARASQPRPASTAQPTKAAEHRAALELQRPPASDAAGWQMGDRYKSELQDLLLSCTQVGFDEAKQLGRIRQITGRSDFQMQDLRILDAAEAAKVLASLRSTMRSLQSSAQRAA